MRLPDRRSVVGLALVACTMAAFSAPKITFDKDTPINDEIKKLKFNEERILQKSSTYQYNLSSLIGHVLYPQKVAGQCQPTLQDSYDAGLLSKSYLKPSAKLEVKSVNTVLYDSKTDKGGAADLSIFAFSGSITVDNLAQVTITDAAFLSLPQDALVDDWAQQAINAMTANDCTPILINGAKTRVATYKYYHKSTKKAGFLGSVFGVSGNIYNEDGRTANETVIAIDPIIARKSRVGAPTVLSIDESKKFLPSVFEVAKEFKPHP